MKSEEYFAFVCKTQFGDYGVLSKFQKTVEHRIDFADQSVSDLVGEFSLFLLACGYSVTKKRVLEILSEEYEDDDTEINIDE